MKKGWTITKLIAIGAISAMMLLVKIAFYAPLLISTGSIFAGLATFLYGPFFVVLVALIIKQFGAVTIFSFLFFLINLPSPSIFPKMVNFISYPLTGLIIDALSVLVRGRQVLFSFLAGFIYNLLWILGTIILYFTIGLPGTGSVPQSMVTPVGLTTAAVIFSLLGGFFGYLGYLIYQKIKDTAVVRRIQG